jgi:hypothetical protein
MNHQKGVSTLEILMVAFISTLVLSSLLRFLVVGHPISRITYLQLQSTETARLQLQRLARSLRETRQADNGAYPLEIIEPKRLVFYANVDDQPDVERVRYELIGTNLVRGITKPTGTPYVYNPAQEQVVTVAATIRNGTTPVFNYYSDGYPVDQTPLTSTAITRVTYIQFTLVIDVDATVDPPAAVIISQVQLRNLKTNLNDIL